MSRFNIFELPEDIKKGLEPFKINFLKTDDESNDDSDSLSEDEMEYDSQELQLSKERPSLPGSAHTTTSTNYDMYNDDDDDESMEKWQWENRAHITGTPFVYFTSDKIPQSKVLSVYKSWFGKEIETNPVKELLDLPIDGQSCILMVGSGHFAGAIIKHRNHKHKVNFSNPGINVNVIHSKTFHRYTTRRKQGGSQSANDASKGKANSAGSTIRRANERMLAEEIKELLHSWSDELNKCTKIFFRAPGRYNKQLLAGYPNAPLPTNDPRLEKIPFASGRPTLNECKTAWLQLTQANIVDAPTPPKFNEPKEPKKALSKEPSVEPEPEIVQEIDPEIENTKAIIDLIKRSKLPGIKTLIQNELHGDFDFRLKPIEKYLAFPTPLLYAAHNDKHNVVSQLLLWGASPLIKNENGQRLGDIGNHKKTREALQIARKKLGEDKWNWKLAKVGPPMSKEDLLANEMKEKLRMREENERQMAEQDKIEREQKIEKLVTKYGGGNKISGGAYSVSRGLSEDDMKLVERERRARAAEARLARFNK